MPKIISPQFIKYIIVGVTSFTFDILLLIGITEICSIKPFFAVIISQLIVLTYNFTVNKQWAFSHTAGAKQALMRYLILTVANYVFGILAMYAGNVVAGIDYRIVRVATVGAMVSWNFLLYKHWVYKQ
ncbi:MAG: GtrA family protein [Candidatus Magasanikbacteria bacterium]|uniref:GtrA/DPMS transmembrane domain-containing protein n=1 Tax=Candidatus Magasanikbacteria bacterium CG10_big_fil_rev_8_21_14_0_10_38_6 TaxID=1974647 RepID=A0A2M6P007_9BACT|nr:GtrA family protein [Candidatus Magasanikbacteria bacterium]NCS72322.1 GtrA family protein [Candidatus Magasanikbacteria bacterium]PIR77037.1 MAG: hypothetical protein COU30_04650 [Candidatus Magasanikbacteria bacterium CG10_big_fil_rev_8_21_14_0_10_38_6]